MLLCCKVHGDQNQERIATLIRNHNLCFVSEDDIDDDGGTEKGADGGDREGVGEDGADEVAEQEDVCSDEGSSRQSEAVVR